MVEDFSKLMVPWAGSPAGRADTEDTPSQPLLKDLLATFERLQRDLRTDLLRSIYAREPEFFEHLVIDVMLAMGYGNRRRDLASRLGRSGDGGVDGVISSDELGLDQIYVQAKRIRPGLPVAVGEVRDFAGSLEAHRATKGVFVTTSHFSAGAVDFCARLSRRIALIDGAKLADVMIRYNIGVFVETTFHVKRPDQNYFRAAQIGHGGRRAPPI